MTLADRQRRHLVVLAVLGLVAAVAVGLVVTGGRSSTTAATTTSSRPTNTTSSLPLPYLGSFPTEAALRRVVRGLDPATLRPSGGSGTTTSVAGAPPTATVAAANRCLATVQHTSDRPLGDVLARAAARVDSRVVLVLAFPAPASGSLPAQRRVVVADEGTCIVRFAVVF